ncbi:MAG: type II secretion system ATPase GspE [Bacteriovoracia bacterium]
MTETTHTGNPGGARADTAAASLKIGQILIRHTSLKSEQLDEALEIQKRDGGFLGEILIRRNLITTSDLMKALCLQLGIGFLSEINANEIDPNLITNIPINYAKAKEVLPVRIEKRGDAEVLIVAVSDPFDESVSEDLKVLVEKPVEILAAASAKIQEAINRVYEKNTANLVDKIEGEFEEAYDFEGPIDILDANEDDAPVIKFVNSLLFRAVKEKTSDIHIEPYEKDFVVRYRVDGVLHDIVRQPKKAHAAISSRIKVMGSLDIAEKRLPQDGRIKVKIAGKDIDIRLSTVPTIFGERIVMRILEQSGNVLELEQLGFRSESRVEIEKLISRKHGIMLVTGPTGSGKSTTLSACLTKIADPEVNVLTVEDPIEYQIPGISQVQVNAKIELTFARALRHFLRQDPDVIMVGEIRDKETAEIAINASLTGHLVLSTIHTNDAAGAPTRLIDMGVEPFLVASSLIGIVAQRLIRRVCKVCRKPHTPTRFQMEELGMDALPPGAEVYEAVGCPACSQSGYSGRTVIHELMIVDEEVRRLIVKLTDAGSIKKAAVAAGMKTLREDGIAKVLSGQTTIDELIRVTHAEE